MDGRCREALTAIGYTHYLEGALEDARDSFRRAIEHNNDEWYAHRLLGGILRREGNFEGASSLLARAIALRPDYIPTYDCQYTALLGLKRADAAIEIADQGEPPLKLTGTFSAFKNDSCRCSSRRSA